MYDYADDFGGSFADKNGILNICVVGDRTPFKSDYLIYKRVENSFKFLISIEKGLFAKSDDYSIWYIFVCSVCNRTAICLKDKSMISAIVEYPKEQNLYKKHTLMFHVAEDGIIPH